MTCFNQPLKDQVETSSLFQNEHAEASSGKIALIFLILEVMIFLEIKVMSGKNSSVIHKLPFLNLLKDMIIMPYN